MTPSFGMSFCTFRVPVGLLSIIMAYYVHFTPYFPVVYDLPTNYIIMFATFGEFKKNKRKSLGSEVDLITKKNLIFAGNKRK